jgi:hypothetical protein
MPPSTTAVQRKKNVVLSSWIDSYPNATFVPDDAILQRKPFVVMWIDAQFSQQLFALGVISIPSLQIVHPCWSSRGYSQDVVRRGLVGEGISSQIRTAFLILNLVAKTHQLKEGFVLQWRMESLIDQMQETFVISANNELLVLEVWPPLVYYDKYARTFFFIG